MTGHGISCTCGACELAGGVLVAPENRPAMPQLAYRRGSFAGIRAAILSDLGVARGDTGAIRPLTARADDHAITLAELWSVVGDVLGFYNERYANEAFLGTATHTRSIERLARLVGYRRRPGTAALAWLVFDAEPTAILALPAGTRVQSVPGPALPGQAPPLPQTFETLDAALADGRLNALHGYVSLPTAAPFQAGSTSLIVTRMNLGEPATSLRARDRVAIWGTGTNAFEVAEVAEVVERVDHIQLRWSTPLVGVGAGATARVSGRVLRAFGANAPATWMEPQTVPGTTPPTTRWVIRQLGSTVVGAGATAFDLDVKADDITAGTEVLVTTPGSAPRLVRVTAVGAATPTVGSLTDNVTRLTVSPALPQYDRTRVALHVVSGPPIAGWAPAYGTAALGTVLRVPAWSADPVDGQAAVEIGRSIERRTWKAGEVLPLDSLAKGRVVLVEPDEAQASLAAAPRPVVCRLAADVVLPTYDGTGFGHLRLELLPVDDADLSQPGWAAVESVWVRGNVVRASHGETVDEVLGNGDAARPVQRFALQRGPLTYVPAAMAGGSRSTLRVYVDGVRRDEVTTLYGQPPAAAVVETATRPDGVTTVMGGDDRTAARFTTGTGNVSARYRFGSGLAGRVDARSLTTLLTKPTGLRSVINPLAAEGGADPEPTTELRSRAPASVRALGRAVSLRDVDDLLLLAGNVAKAQSVWLWNGLDRFIHVSVATPGDGPLSTTLRGLLAASLDAVRDPSVRIAIDDAVRVGVELTASVVVDQRAEDAAAVIAQVDAVARAMLGFDNARLGRGIALSDVIAVLAAVPLVIGVDVDRFGFAPGELTSTGLTLHGVATTAGVVAAVQPRLRALPARPGQQRGEVHPAELLIVRQPSHLVIIDGGRG